MVKSCTIVLILILQSICLVTPFSHLRNLRASQIHLNTADSDNFESGYISEVTTLEDDYIQRFTNVARLYENNVNTTLLYLRNSHVCVVGLGGVGSWCVEALARSGISRFTLIDMDDICISNTNRQIQALTSTVGQFKGEALRNRVLDINPYAIVEVQLDFLRPTNVDEIVAGNVIKTISESNDDNDSNNSNSDSDNSDSDNDNDSVISINDSDTSNSDKNSNNEAVEADDYDDAPFQLSGPSKFDFLIDAADGVTDKAFMIDACVRSGTPIVVCGGAGGLTDPTLLRIR
jgi:tRNA A37 threonylcarbamoyladenosine dehydratase